MAPPPALAPPPRTIADIRAILDREKPDVEKIAARKAKADEQPPAGLAGAALSQFYYDRGSARAALGRARDALEDGLKGLDLAKSVGEFERIVNLTGFIAIRYEDLGDLQKANETLDGLVRLAEAQGKRGATINPLAEMARIAMQSGEISQGEAYARRVAALAQEARGSPNPGWRQSYAIYGASWEADAAQVAAIAAESHGLYAQAEAGYRRAEAFRRAVLKDLPKFAVPVAPEQPQRAAEVYLMQRANIVAKEGRLSEAEALARRALLDILDQLGRYSPKAPQFIAALASIIVEEGRYGEAEVLARSATIRR